MPSAIETRQYLKTHLFYKKEEFEDLFGEDDLQLVFQANQDDPQTGEWGIADKFYLVKAHDLVVKLEFENRSQLWFYKKLGKLGDPSIEKSIRNLMLNNAGWLSVATKADRNNQTEIGFSPVTDDRGLISNWGERLEYSCSCEHYSDESPPLEIWLNQLCFEQLFAESTLCKGLSITTSSYRAKIGAINFYLIDRPEGPQIVVSKNVSTTMSPIVFYKFLGQPGDGRIMNEIETSCREVIEASKMSKELIVEDTRSSVANWNPIFLSKELKQ
ncbi:MAG: hypothetical protein HRT45_13360 [Bdellovibrionales bacterium]|nr:hypothetical protein [Bdellovibrionales bacterium]